LTIPHYGKREAGLLTAASPGDTLYFAFGAYNDSGDSEVLTGLAVTDIEVIKNGAATVRATDSGYSLISDTGMVGDRAGLYRVSVQLFNTADDASFYATGSWYQAFVDAVTIDGKTVRFWLGSWEIGREKANVVELDSDTGFADQLGKFSSLLHTTGQLTGSGTLITNPPAVNVLFVDSDTGAADQLGKAFTTTPTYFQQVDTRLLDGDTGAADLLGKFANLLNSGGAIQAATTSGGSPPVANVTMIRTDTGAANQLFSAFANGFNDTGINDRLGRIGFDVDTGLRAQISDVDTGLHDTLADYDTGLRAILQTTGVNVTSFADTGVTERLQSIQDKTDSLTFTVAGQVDANIQYVNDVQVNGSGASGDEWGP
jgi:hypothetical protein